MRGRRDSGTAHVLELDDNKNDDGVKDDLDLCGGTVVPEAVPTERLR